MSLHLFGGVLSRASRVALPLSHVVVHEPPAPPAPVLVPYDWASEPDIVDEDDAR